MSIDLIQTGPISKRGRIQDNEYNPDLKSIEILGKAGPISICYLCEKILNETKIDQPIIHDWPDLKIGDIAYKLLCNIFITKNHKSTIWPEIRYNELLQLHDSNRSEIELFNAFIANNGRADLRDVIRNVLDPYELHFTWDNIDMCFKPEVAQLEVLLESVPNCLYNCFHFLEEMNTPEVNKFLLKCADSRNQFFRNESTRILSIRKNSDVLPMLLQAISNPDTNFRQHLHRGLNCQLINITPNSSVNGFLSGIDACDPYSCDYSLYYLQVFGYHPILEQELLELAESNDPIIIERVLYLLGKTQSSLGIPLISQYLNNEKECIKNTARWALGQFETPEVKMIMETDTLKFRLKDINAHFITTKN